MPAFCDCVRGDREPQDRTVGEAHTGEKIRERTCLNCNGLIKVLH